MSLFVVLSISFTIYTLPDKKKENIYNTCSFFRVSLEITNQWWDILYVGYRFLATQQNPQVMLNVDRNQTCAEIVYWL